MKCRCGYLKLKQKKKEKKKKLLPRREPLFTSPQTTLEAIFPGHSFCVKATAFLISKLRLGLIQSGQRKVAADSPFSVSSCSASAECNRQDEEGERTAGLPPRRRLQQLSAVFDASGNVRRSAKRGGRKSVRDNSPLNSNSLESDCLNNLGGGLRTGL